MIDDAPPPERPGDADAVLAGEYVLRLLGPAEAAACAEREVRDPAFAALAEEWRAELAGLDGAFAPLDPPARLQARIEARLFGGESSRLARIWQSAGLWRAVAAAAALVAVYLGSLVVPLAPPPGEPEARLISAIASVESEVELLAWIEPEAAVLTLNRTGGAPAPGRSLQLWLVEEGEAPVSLGVLPATARARVPLTRELAARIEPGDTLAVSDEPAGGSPTPTRVVAAGPVSEI